MIWTILSALFLSAAGAHAQGSQPVTAARASATHWAWQPIRLVSIPTVKDNAWCKTPIDRFIFARLEAKGLKPSPPADRRTLIRRLSFDLIGLPPTPQETDSFVHDPDTHAYEKLVARLLASPRYGERWGRHWLDVVHYGDTHGYDKDKRRDNAWPYRDYVIKALNEDKPYGRFIREQIAGDVLWPKNADAVVATGFVAAGPWDFVGQEELREGTVEKEKTRLLDRDDMVANTLSTFCSVTVHCARCHDHKFDPIPQRDYYRLQACFAGVDRRNRPIPDAGRDTRRAELEKKRDQLALTAKSLDLQIARAVGADPAVRELDGKLASLDAEIKAGAPPGTGEPSPTNGYHSAIENSQDSMKWVQVDLGNTVPIERVRLIPARPTDFPDTSGFGFPVRFSVAVSDDPEFKVSASLLDATASDYANPGDRPVLVQGKGIAARYVRVTANRLWKRTADYVFALGELQVLSGGREIAGGQPVSALDSIEEGRWSTKYLVDGFDSRRRLLDLSNPSVASAVQKYEELMSLREQLAAERQKRAGEIVPAALRTTASEVSRDQSQIEAELKGLPSVPVVFALQSHAPRPISILARGDVEKPLETVPPGALSCVTGLSSDFKLSNQVDEGSRRAALAEWIASPRNALTWRSIVNRVWQYHFGKGIVDTPNDFGRNGGKPSHPELLDWLAAEFAAPTNGSGKGLGQSIKSLHRMIVLSAAYQQSSGDNEEYERVDGDNRLLWRMTRQRLDAECVRDAVLAVSGTLDPTMGGPGFELFHFKDDHSPVYDHSAIERINDPKGWRRSVYRFVVRSVPNPFMECLDCADPNISTPVRSTTLTALQALAMLNDPFILDQSRHFADRVVFGHPVLAAQIREAFRLALCREPSKRERSELGAYTQKHSLSAACRLLLNSNEFMFVD